jgi:hypothetical protein
MVAAYEGIVQEVQDKRNHIDNIDLLLKEQLIRVEILKRDFTKRQMNILGFILVLSMAYGKEWAVIPRMKDFELAGISSIKIRSEIDQLVEKGVIKWNQEENLFSITNPREWTTKHHSGYSDSRIREVFIVNLKHSGVDFEKLKSK